MIIVYFVLCFLVFAFGIWLLLPEKKKCTCTKDLGCKPSEEIVPITIEWQIKDEKCTRKGQIPILEGKKEIHSDIAMAPICMVPESEMKKLEKKPKKANKKKPNVKDVKLPKNWGKLK